MKFGAGGLYSETQAEREAKLGRSRTTHGFSEAREWCGYGRVCDASVDGLPVDPLPPSI